MPRTATYSTTELEQAVSSSVSVAGVMRLLGVKQAGGSHSHLCRKIKKLGLDTSHFTGQAHNRGKPSLKKKTADQTLIRLPEGSARSKAKELRRAMLEVGFEHKCSPCGISTWQGKDLVLEIDHIDGDWLNNLRENLRFICPNCHSQCVETNRSWKSTSST